MADVKCFPSTATTFTSNGLKIIQPYKCRVTEEAENGDYYVEIEAPASDSEYLKQGMIVSCMTHNGWQAFRLKNPLRTSHRVKVKGRHVYFDTENYIVLNANIQNRDCQNAMALLYAGLDRTGSPFTYSSDIQRLKTYTCQNKIFKDAIEDIVSTWNGHLFRDNYEIRISNTANVVSGETAAYGKNIISFDMDENWDDVCTRLLPTGKDGITTHSVIQTIGSTKDLYDIKYTKIVAFDQDIEQAEGETEADYKNRLRADLEAQAQAYLETHSQPDINYKVKADLSTVKIGDTLRVKYPPYNVDINTDVIKVVYDSIAERVVETEFGNFRKATMKNYTKAVSNNVSTNLLSKTVTSVLELLRTLLGI